MDKSSKIKLEIFIFLLVLAVVSFVYYFISDAISLWSVYASPWLVILVYTLLNPINWFFIYYLVKDYGLRGLASGLLIAIDVDIISLAHSILRSGGLPQGTTASPLYTLGDTAIYKGLIIPIFGTGWFGVFFMYFIFTVIIAILAALIVDHRIFKKIINKIIH